MPIDKLDSINTVRRLDTNFVCCKVCGETKRTLYRVREGGKKTKPAKYLCARCSNANIH